jgi:catechol 2,3-dioxygenase-like lactoylglutathione lyase family enzyme
MVMAPAGDGYRCSAPGREVQLSPGPANQLRYAHFALQSQQAWARFSARVQLLALEPLPPAFAGQSQALSLRDPDGNQLVFTLAPPAPLAQSDMPQLPATLQHFALRSPDLEPMLAFYSQQLGFVLSDAVKDPEGVLRACFLRTDTQHHALALFFAPVSCFDHQSFEAPDWDSMKQWGDHMAAIRQPIVWGLGRHGPGNDVFFMVRDPDGNLAEISSEIEQCAPDRPAGLWPHEERTLNLWGKAILRS